MNDVARAAIASGLPLMLWGPPGCGKSSWAASTGAATVVPCAGVQAEDLGGYPHPVGGALQMLPPPWLVPEDDGILILDDVPDASPSVLAALYAVVHGRKLACVTLSPSLRIILTGNPASSNSTGEGLPPALANRLVHVSCAETSGEGDATGIWPAGPPPYSPPPASSIAVNAAVISAYRRSRGPTHYEADHETGALPTSRTWRAMAILMAAGIHPLEAGIATVGRAAAAEAAAWINKAKLPEPLDVIRGKAAVPDAIDQAWATLTAVTALAASDKSLCDDAWRVLCKQPAPILAAHGRNLALATKAHGLDIPADCHAVIEGMPW